MLLLQTITLRWHKKERAAPFSTARNRFLEALDIPKNMHFESRLGFPRHIVYYLQEEERFLQRHEALKYSPIQDRFQQSPLHFQQNAEGHWKIDFQYEWSIGAPARTNGEDRRFKKEHLSLIPHDRSHLGLLRETAFTLQPGEYGRVSFNGKHLTYEYTYYEKQIHNIIYLPDFDTNQQQAQFFTERAPTYHYSQLARLW